MGSVSVKKIIKNIVPYGLIKEYKKKKKSEEHYETVSQRELYNAEGGRIYTYFLKDKLCVAHPWGFVYGRTPKTILWDRFHPGLETHFYTSSDILETVGKPRKKFAYLIESEAIVPEDYRMFDTHKGLDKEFALIFTFSEKLLNQYSNARFLPASGVWYGNEFSRTPWDVKGYEKKEKNISIIASNKQMCQLHEFRKQIAMEMKYRGQADAFGTFDGGKRLEFVDPTLTAYRYQIVIENEIKDYYFTEKLLNCFAAMTIPIYIGARKIGEFFNTDGMIQVRDPSEEAVQDAIKQCTERFYEEHIPAVLDNFNRVHDFLCPEDYLMLHYGRELE